ncbi:MAG: DUF222 domain-containing protein [Acidimicrobiales bacterium]|nr:DUF222 domain-containing protein [Acidimicrobiales bacterium]
MHAGDGHRSAKVMVRHVANLSDAKAARRDRRARCLARLPEVREAFAAGRVGVSQVDRIARVASNPRVRDQLWDLDEDLAVVARKLPYRQFDRVLANWEAMVDEDGARDRNQATHEARDSSLLQDFDGTWTDRGRCAALAGAHQRAVRDAFYAAELDADWCEARSRLGDAATFSDLRRADAQRRADAIVAIHEAAADVFVGRPGGHRIVTNAMIDQRTFEREVVRLAGHTPLPRRPDLTLSDLTPDPFDADVDAPVGGEGSFRCDTLEGWRLEPTEAVAAALLGHIRRVVYGADGVVIDQGRTQRCFTGAAQIAARLASQTCIWPGCGRSVVHSQVDHLNPWHRGGRTDQANGAIVCGRHNRLKEHGYTIERHPDGSFTVTRPDGTPIPATGHGPHPPTGRHGAGEYDRPPPRSSVPGRSGPTSAAPGAQTDPGERPRRDQPRDGWGSGRRGPP